MVKNIWRRAYGNGVVASTIFISLCFHLIAPLVEAGIPTTGMMELVKLHVQYGGGSI